MYCRLHQLVGMLPLFRIIHWRKSTKISDCIPFAVTIFLLRFQLFYSARGQEEPNAYSSPKKEFLQSSRCHGSAILQFLVGNLTRLVGVQWSCCLQDSRLANSEIASSKLAVSPRICYQIGLAYACRVRKFTKKRYMDPENIFLERLKMTVV